MKKILQGTFIVLLSSFSILILQISCSKSQAQQNVPSNVTQIGKIVYAQYDGSDIGFWIANYDGTNQTHMNLTLPAGYVLNNSHDPKLSPDGTKLFFVAINVNDSYKRSIFTCNIDGTNLQSIVYCPNTSEIQLGGAY